MKRKGETMGFKLNLWNMNESTAEAYKSGYSDCEKKYATMESQYNTVVKQLKKLGYEVGEDVNVIKSASVIAKHCKSNVGCKGCEFYVAKTDSCILSGSNPADWRIG